MADFIIHYLQFEGFEENISLSDSLSALPSQSRCSASPVLSSSSLFDGAPRLRLDPLRSHSRTRALSAVRLWAWHPDKAESPLGPEDVRNCVLDVQPLLGIAQYRLYLAILIEAKDMSLSSPFTNAATAPDFLPWTFLITSPALMPLAYS